ncbi:M4 family metallopeptidase [Legionella sp.]|uniref:M4 family metallopeptidase n=1 Tax=Legionella sp. TaxID=459 RepID=UPI003C8327E4
MLKKLLGFIFIFISYDVFAVASKDLYQAPLSSLKPFSLLQKGKLAQARSFSTADTNVLQELNQTNENTHVITRYQQMYHGLPVVGAQIMIIKDKNLNNDKGHVNGHLLDDIQLNTHPTLTPQQAFDIAQKSWFNFNPQTALIDKQIELQIRAGQNNELRLVYLVSFKSTESNNKPAWPFFVVEAHNGELIKQWNNIKNFADSGPGGNEKIKEYWYGKDGLPPLEVTQNGALCTMESAKVKLVDLKFAWDWSDFLATPSQYPCGNNLEDSVNGAFSVANDAYYFGHTIVEMYQEWYGINALQHANGTPAQLVMRVHFGQNYDNAFWDGEYMSFGDGSDFYPLVSLEIAAHEVTHGFTEQHANLEYHDQSGALNESLSDMAGQAARAYMLEKFPQLYNKIYLEPNLVTWGIGETIVRDSFGKALRFMDFPSSDGSSADCLDKVLAQSKGAYCTISYEDVVTFAHTHIFNPQEKQDFIVHTASGVFNKAFYLLAQNIGIKKAYHVMIIANSKYWGPTTNFVQGACGVLYGARDLAVSTDEVKAIFGQVGVDTTMCSI